MWAKILTMRLIGGALLGLIAATAAYAAEPTGEIVLMAYPRAFQDNYTKTVIEPFMKAYPGAKVIYNAPVNPAQMLGMLGAQKAKPEADVVIIDFSVSRVANKEGLFEKFDAAAVPNFVDIYDEARMPDGWGPGITFDNLVMIYNAELVKPAPTGVKDLLDPANKGKIAFSPAPNVIGISLQIVVAKHLGLDYKGSPDPVIETLKKIAPNVQTWHATPDNYTIVINGAVSYGIGWNPPPQLYSDNSDGQLKSIVIQDAGFLYMHTHRLVVCGWHARPQ